MSTAHATRRRWLLRVAAAMIAAVSAASSAQDAAHYPERAVHIIVPFAAGGGTDLTARVIATQLQRFTGVAFVVENRPGASGNIGNDAVAAATPDGYTLLVSQTGIAINETLLPASRTKVLRDLTPIAMLAKSPVVIGGNPSLHLKGIHDLIRFARANPGRVSYTSCGVGTPQHVAGELFNSMAKTDMLHVPYKGCAPAMSEVVNGQAQVIFSTIANVNPFVSSGRLDVYAVTSAARSPLVPSIPTARESGLPGYDIDVWFGMFGPAGMDKSTVGKLNSLVNRALASEEVRKTLAASLYEPAQTTPAGFDRVVRRDVERFARIITDANIKPE